MVKRKPSRFYQLQGALHGGLWKTGLPLPDDLRSSIERVSITLNRLYEGYVIPLKALPKLREVTIKSGLHCIDTWAKEWSKSWADYKILTVAQETALVATCRLDSLKIQWIRELYQEAQTRQFKLVFESGIIFPDIRRFATKVMEMTYTCDFDTDRLITKTFEESEDLFEEYARAARWTMPVENLWQLRDNAELNKVSQ